MIFGWLFANVIAGWWHTNEMYLMESETFWTNPWMLLILLTIMEHLTVKSFIGVVSINKRKQTPFRHESLERHGYLRHTLCVLRNWTTISQVAMTNDRVPPLLILPQSISYSLDYYWAEDYTSASHTIVVAFELVLVSLVVVPHHPLHIRMIAGDNSLLPMEFDLHYYLIAMMEQNRLNPLEFETVMDGIVLHWTPKTLQLAARAPLECNWNFKIIRNIYKTIKFNSIH